MTEFPVPDCLVLKIESKTPESQIETTIYILYDKKYHNYVIRGFNNNNPFSFNCEYADDLIYFITFIMSKENLWCYSLYNYDNLYVESNDITFDFLYNNYYEEGILAIHENKKYNRRELMQNLRMLRNVFNCYN